MVHIDEDTGQEEETRDKYANVSALQLLMLNARIKLLKAMSELIAMKMNTY